MAGEESSRIELVAFEVAREARNRLLSLGLAVANPELTPEYVAAEEERITAKLVLENLVHVTLPSKPVAGGTATQPRWRTISNNSRQLEAQQSDYYDF